MRPTTSSRSGERNRSAAPVSRGRLLLNDLIRSQQQRLRDGDAENPGGLEVDHQLELRRLLEGQISWLCASEDLVREVGGTPPQLILFRPVAQQGAGRLGIRAVEHARNSLLRGKVHDFFAVLE